MQKVFAEIERQCEYRFFYTEETLNQSLPVSFSLKNAPLEEVLKLAFHGQALSYQIEGKNIVVRKKIIITPTVSNRVIRGRIITSNGDPAPGVTVTCKIKNSFATSDNQGAFSLVVNEGVVDITVSGAEIESQNIRVINDKDLIIKVSNRINELDQVVLMGYGQTTRRLNTGNIAKVDNKIISRQPVTNPLAALQGQVPGLIITQSNGYASSPFNVQLRGQNSISQNSQPLYVIDGVPFAMQSSAINQFNSASLAGLSPFYTMNPADIESIEILKDADATAIYGSRGANGVILITTRKGLAGQLQVNALIQNGWAKTTRTMEMLNTQQYVAMRREAFTNDGITPALANAADLLAWDTTRYTDLRKVLTGGTAKTYDAQISASGGTSVLNFSLNASYHRESTVLPIDRADQRIAVHNALQYRSSNKRLQLDLSTSFSSVQNNLPNVEPNSYINRPPNLKLYDSLGKLNWLEGGVRFGSTVSDFPNPLASLNTIYEARLQNFITSLQFRFQFTSTLYFKVSLGFNSLRSDEFSGVPVAAIDPTNANTRPRANFGNRSNQTWIIEPQAGYQRRIGSGNLSLLIGSSWQSNEQKSLSVAGSNYSNDLLLRSTTGAGTISTSNDYTQYRYHGAFGRLTYNMRDRYILNLTTRRDGSSRFGPNNRFHNFGAAGGAWIFSNERWMKPISPVLSFGKLRASYGTTGNDGIGDYQYLDRWTNPASRTYQGVPILSPASLFNPNLAWEVNRKLEIGIEVGFFHRVQFSMAAFRNRSGNQLVAYTLPIQTGFFSVLQNQSALVENKGLEWTLETKNIQSKSLTWASSLNVSVTRNNLVAFPGLETSSYANILVIGQPLSVRRLLHYRGVDPATGLYQFEDVDRNGVLNFADRTSLQNLQPSFYGGLQNTVNWKNVEIAIHFQFVRQRGLNYLNTLNAYGGPPGNRYRNQPVIASNRWQYPGDHSDIQRFTTTLNTGDLPISDAIFSDASFIRCKNVSISYSLPTRQLRGLKITQLRIFCLAQNLFVLTGYKGADPESQNLFTLPPLRNVTAGIQLTL